MTKVLKMTLLMIAAFAIFGCDKNNTPAGVDKEVQTDQDVDAVAPSSDTTATQAAAEVTVVTDDSAGN